MGILQKQTFKTFVNKNSTDPGVLTPYVEANGVIAEVEVGEAVAIGDLLYYKEADKQWMKADSDNSATLPALAMALTAATADGDTVVATMYGHVKSQRVGLANRASGTITISGNVANGEYFTIAGLKYEFSTDGSVAAGDVLVDVSAAQDKATAQAALLAAFTSVTKGKFTYGAFAADVLTLYAKYPTYKGTEGNVLTLVKSGTNLAVSGATLSGGNDGGLIYAGKTTPVPVYTAPGVGDFVQAIGMGLSADEIFLAPSLAVAAGS
jgi:hypothetical protein